MKLLEERLIFNCVQYQHHNHPKIVSPQSLAVTLREDTTVALVHSRLIEYNQGTSNCVTTEPGCYSATRYHSSTILVSPQSLDVTLRQDTTVALVHSRLIEYNQETIDDKAPETRR
ncbi:hypothetical protein J6590_075394 [Homalodisca vitripennis]|nr:hypothetical protein J6590_075394 [Homalodisca vitripennis]